MNNWSRQTMLDDAFFDMHGIKPEVYYDRINRNEYSIKIVYQGKEAILTEVMDKGLTKSVTLLIDNKSEPFKSMYEAEIEIVRRFKE